jgi:hypothetical protein
MPARSILPSLAARPSSSGLNGRHAAHDSAGLHEPGRGWWLALAAVVPIGLSLLALGLRARRRPTVDEYEAWWQARAAARQARGPEPVPAAKIPVLFI